MFSNKLDIFDSDRLCACMTYYSGFVCACIIVAGTRRPPPPPRPCGTFTLICIRRAWSCCLLPVVHTCIAVVVSVAMLLMCTDTLFNLY